MRLEREKQIWSRLDDDTGRLWHLVPRARNFAERLGDDHPRLVRNLLQELDLGMLRPQPRDIRAVEKRPRLPFARIAEGPDLFAVRSGDRHLDRVLDAVPTTSLLDQSDRPGDRPGRIVLKPKSSREEEEHLRIGRAA